MADILKLINDCKWNEALNAFFSKLNSGSLDDYDCILGATILEHFEKWSDCRDIILYGLDVNPLNYELYLLLGNYYSGVNPNLAYLTYQNALYFAKDQGNEDDAAQISDIMQALTQNSSVSVRNVSFIILSYNTLDYTRQCIESIRENCYRDCYEIIVVDNASSDGSAEWLREQTDIVLAENIENVGFPAGCNQGIKMADSANDILLLNSDTLLMPNSLYTLRMGLYDNPLNGSAGSVTNYAGNNQIAFSSDEGLEAHIEFATKNNLPGNNPYELKSMLIMFAMLIKREVFEKVGNLDESFSPGNYEDNDYGIRILEAGFRNVLCWNSFIYHYGHRSFADNPSAYNELMKRNFNIFVDKWGFSPNYYMHARWEILPLIEADTSFPINVLEIGCGLGDTLAAIKHRYPNASVHGIEIVPKIAALGASKFDISCGDIEELDFPSDVKFDYIIFADVLEHLRYPNAVLNKLRNNLKDEGFILCSIPNIMNANVIYNLLHGNFTYQDAGILDRTHLRFFTENEVHRLFNSERYEVDYIKGTIDPKESTSSHAEFFDGLLKLVGEDKKLWFDVYQFIIRAKKTL